MVAGSWLDLEPASEGIDESGSDDDDKNAHWADDRLTPAFADEEQGRHERHVFCGLEENCHNDRSRSLPRLDMIAPIPFCCFQITDHVVRRCTGRATQKTLAENCLMRHFFKNDKMKYVLCRTAKREICASPSSNSLFLRQRVRFFLPAK
jgi:hypothetical protein